DDLLHDGFIALSSYWRPVLLPDFPCRGSSYGKAAGAWRKQQESILEDGGVPHGYQSAPFGTSITCEPPKEESACRGNSLGYSVLDHQRANSQRHVHIPEWVPGGESPEEQGNIFISSCFGYNTRGA